MTKLKKLWKSTNRFLGFIALRKSEKRQLQQLQTPNVYDSVRDQLIEQNYIEMQRNRRLEIIRDKIMLGERLTPEEQRESGIVQIQLLE